MPSSLQPLRLKRIKPFGSLHFGTIVGRDAHDNTLRVDHEAIPGFMEAMTMDYSVRGAKVAELPPNKTRVEARLHVSDDGYWLTDVKKAP